MADLDNIWIEGYQPPPHEDVITSNIRTCSPNYFRAMGVPLLKGRAFAEQDTKDLPGVVIVDENLVHRYWPNENPIGKRLKLGNPQSPSPWLTVVGVVGRVKQYALDQEDSSSLYLSSTQYSRIAMYLVARGASDPASLTAAIKAEVRALDAELPVYDVMSMEQRIGNSLSRRRFSLLLLSASAAIALMLAGVGVYGVTSYSVTRRTPEIGIRLALGAQSADVLKLVVREGLTLALVGVAVGLIIALALTGLMTNLLFEVSATDPATLAVIALLLTAVALLACWIPARRTAKVDPLVALRND